MNLTELKADLGTILNKVKEGTLTEKYSGRIPNEYIYQTDPSTGQVIQAFPSGQFQPDQNYLQFTINQMYLSESRRLWVEREHLGAIWMSFRYAGGMQAIPFTVGRDLLVDRVKHLPPDARIEFRNVRVGKIYPYVGDGLSIYLGLWSTKTVDWAKKVFSALDIIAGKVKIASSLRSMLDIIGVLNQGISILLGLDDIEPHLNLYQEFQDTASSIAPLQSGYYVMIDVPNATFDSSTLCVLDGKLSVKSCNGQIAPFYNHNFLLYNIESLSFLSYAPDLFSAQCQAIVTELIASQEDKNQQKRAAREYDILLNQIIASPDLTQLDKHKLINHYHHYFSSENMTYIMNPLRRGERHLGEKKQVLPPGIELPTEEEFVKYCMQVDPIALNTDLIIQSEQASADFVTNLQHGSY